MSAFSAIFKSVIANDPTSIGDALLPLDPAILPAGVSFDPATSSFAFDTSTPSYVALAEGQTSSVTLNYAAADGTPTSVELILTGANDAPIVTGPVTGLFVNESGLGGAYDVAALLSTAHDPDSADKLRVVFDQSSLPAGVTFATTPEHVIPSFIVPAHTIAAGPRATPWGNYVYPVTYVPETLIPEHVVPEATTLSIDPTNVVFQSLAQGDEQTVVVNYQITDGIAFTDAQAIFTVNGMNDAPVVTGPVTAAATEGGASVTIAALANATDVDHGSVLTLVAAPAQTAPVPAALTGAARDAAEQAAAIAQATQIPGTAFDASSLPPGVSFDAASNSFTLDPTDPAYQRLSQGQTATVTINYGVSDGIATTAAQAVFTVTGVNQAPTVSGPATGVAVTEDGVAGVYDRTALLANASDVDMNDTIGLIVDPAQLPDGISYHHADATTATVTTDFFWYGIHTLIVSTVGVPVVDTLTIDPTSAAFQSLAAGETLDVVATYQVTDGIASTTAQAIFHIIGTNDAPIVSGPGTGTATEDGMTATINGLAAAHDVDHGSVLSIVAAPVAPLGDTASGGNGIDPALAPSPILPFDTTTLPSGVSFDAATNSFTIDPSNAAYQSLSAGQIAHVVVNYGVTDGLVATAAQAVFTVVGTNDAPVVSGPVTGLFVNEDGVVGAYNLAALLATAHDVDQNDKLAVIFDPANLPDGVTYASTPEHITPGYTIPAHVIPAGPRGTSWGAYVYPAQYVPAVVVPDQVTPATSTLSIDPSNAAFQSLAQGEEREVVVTYKISDGTVSVDAQAVFTVNGMNDAPVVAGPVAAAVVEDGAAATVDGLANATDIDHGSVLTLVAAPIAIQPVITAGESARDIAEATALAAAAPPAISAFDPSVLPVGVDYDATTHSFTIDPTNAAFQSLGLGQTRTITINYGVSDGITVTAAQAVLTVTGTNDAPVVTGPTHALAVTGNGRVSLSVLQLLANASDVDNGDTLSVVGIPTVLPTGVSQAVSAGGFVTIVDPTAYYGVRYVAAPVGVTLTIDPSDSAYASLAAGETLDVTVNYGVSDGHVTTAASAIFTVVGINDAPVISAPIVAAATEDGAVVTIDALAHATDVDHGAVLSVVNVPAILPAGVSYDAASHSFAINPADASFQSLSVGQTTTLTIAYGVSDGMATVATTASFVVTGTNDLPVVSAAKSFAAIAGTAAFTVNPLANVTDVDSLDVLKLVAGPLADGVHTTLIPGGYYQPDIQITQFFPNDPAFRSLAQGEVGTVTWNYDVTDGHSVVHDTMIFTVTGVNDAPVITSPNVAATTEAGARVTINALANAIDDDHGALLSVVNVPTVLPTGISYDAATHSFTLDPTNAVFQSLAQGQVGAYSVAYGVSDGMVTTATTATFNVTGVNNATVISGPALGTANEGGALANIDARVNATDIDTPIESLRVVNLPTILPAGVSFNAATQKFFLDPTNAAYRFLSVGETTTIVIPYSLTDGYAVVPTSAVFTVTGKNNAPTVTATVNGGTVLETAAPVTLKLLANASDVDHLDVLNVSLTPGSGVAATVSSGIWSAPIAFTIANNQLSLNPSQFANLALGKTVGITFNYQVTDGNPGGTIAASATLAVQGVYGGPTGVAIAPQTALLGKLLGGSGLNAKSVLANLVETGGIASNSYSYALSGTGAGAFTIGSSAGTAQLSTGTSGPIGAAGGQLYALGISTTDTSAGLSSAASPLDVVVGLGRGSNIINLASLPGMAAATPTFIFDLGGSDTVNGAGMTGKLWLDGGQGADTMTGGSGANTYLYSATADSTATAMDIITNFHAAADMLDFTGLGSKFTSVGALATSATSIAGGAIGWQTSGGNMFIYANTSGNSQALTAAAMKIELLGTVGLTGNNFVHL